MQYLVINYVVKNEIMNSYCLYAHYYSFYKPLIISKLPLIMNK